MFTDFNEHIKDIISIQSKENYYLPNFLFYFLANALSFFSGKISLIQISTVFLMSLSTVAKYVISKFFFKEFTSQQPSKKNELVIISASIMLLFSFSIPDIYNYFFLKKLYLGRLVPIVWHNSTTIMVFPFTILLFWKQMKLFKSIIYCKKDILMINILVILNALIKPSFLFVYIPITALILVLKIKQLGKKSFLLAISPIVTGILIILIQYFLIYFVQLGSFYSQNSSITLVSPFKIYNHFIPYWYIPIAFIFSLALPICTIFSYREILTYKPFIYSSQLLILGIIMSAFLSETGPRELHGNFFWQNVICTYLVFLTTITFLLNKFLTNNKKISNKLLLILFVFLTHFLSGVLYIVNIFSTHLYD